MPNYNVSTKNNNLDSCMVYKSQTPYSYVVWTLSITVQRTVSIDSVLGIFIIVPSGYTLQVRILGPFRCMIVPYSENGFSMTHLKSTSTSYWQLTVGQYLRHISGLAIVLGLGLKSLKNGKTSGAELQLSCRAPRVASQSRTEMSGRRYVTRRNPWAPISPAFAYLYT